MRSVTSSNLWAIIALNGLLKRRTLSERDAYYNVRVRPKAKISRGGANPKGVQLVASIGNTSDVVNLTALLFQGRLLDTPAIANDVYLSYSEATASNSKNLEALESRSNR